MEFYLGVGLLGNGKAVIADHIHIRIQRLPGRVILTQALVGICAPGDFDDARPLGVKVVVASWVEFKPISSVIPCRI
jgi:hypothetical protein